MWHGSMFFIAVLFVPNLAFAMCKKVQKSVEDGGRVLFGTEATYQSVYDIIFHYPQYQEALKYHMQSVMELPDNAIVIEAGGGTGIMTREAMNTKRDARIYMCDFNPAMAEHAVAKGIPREHLAVGPKIGDIQNLHIGSRKAKDGEVDLIFSHSVLWNLVDPETFFSEASRVLKKDGILSVSTIRSGTQGITSYFVQSIRDGFKSAVDMRIITLDAANTFADQNAIAVANMEEPGSPVKSTLSPDRIRQIADKYGFEVRDISDCYVVATPNGPKPFFIQFKLKKVS